MLLNILRGFTVQEALDAPRFCISPAMTDAVAGGAQRAADNEVYFEEGIPVSTIDTLRSGYPFTSVNGIPLSNIQAWVMMLVFPMVLRGQEWVGVRSFRKSKMTLDG